MRRNRKSPASPSTALAPAAHPTPTGLRLCGSFEPHAKSKVAPGKASALVFVDPDSRGGSATLTESPGNPAERTVLVNLAPYLAASGNHGAHQHRHAAGHPAHSDPVFADISAVLDTMQASIDTLKEDVDSFKFPTAGLFSGPPRPAA